MLILCNNTGDYFIKHGCVIQHKISSRLTRTNRSGTWLRKGNILLVECRRAYIKLNLSQTKDGK